MKIVADFSSMLSALQELEKKTSKDLYSRFTYLVSLPWACIAEVHALKPQMASWSDCAAFLQAGSQTFQPDQIAV